MVKRAALHKPTTKMLRSLWRYYRTKVRVKSVRDVFRLAYQDVIGGNSGCADTDFRLFSDGDPNPPVYLQRAYLEHSQH